SLPVGFSSHDYLPGNAGSESGHSAAGGADTLTCVATIGRGLGCSARTIWLRHRSEDRWRLWAAASRRSCAGLDHLFDVASDWMTQYSMYANAAACAHNRRAGEGSSPASSRVSTLSLRAIPSRTWSYSFDRSSMTTILSACLASRYVSPMVASMVGSGYCLPS